MSGDGAGGGPAPVPVGAGGAFDITVNLRAIGVSMAWAREQALRLEAAGYAGVAIWDHFVSRGVRSDPVLECWTALTLIAADTHRIRVMPFVLNVMNRHPSVVARMAATLQEGSDGRLVLGVGIGGHPAEHAAYGIAFPGAPERAARLEEAVAVLRSLWTGGPVTRASPWYPLADAFAHPIPAPPPPVVVGAESPAGARLAARIGDGWTVPAGVLGSHMPGFLDVLAESGRSRHRVRVLASFDLAKDESLSGSPWVEAPAEEAARWRDAGADGAVVAARSTGDVNLLVEAAARR
jgi:alkanesulfonate monooxygenase SsuD/methylene tetrahydromethanopterin reductase-like flavin-dependent oxidoreductase (luciferase family)